MALQTPENDKNEMDDEKKNDSDDVMVIEGPSRWKEDCDMHDVFNGYVYAAQILDLRSADEYEKSHIHTATHIDTNEMEKCVLELSQKLLNAHIKTKKRIICIDYSKNSKNKQKSRKSKEIHQKLYELCAKHLQCEWFKLTCDTFDFSSFQENYPFICVSAKVDKQWGMVRKYYPNIIIPNKLYLGDVRNRQSYELLQKLRITHVLDISKTMFDDDDLFEILSIDLNDHPNEPINEYFDQSAEFIENALKKNEKNRVFVHCQMGISRSTTMILCYLMKKKGYSLYEGYKLCQQNRPKIHPNDGFLKHLVALEKEIYGKSTMPQIEEEKLRENRDINCLIM